MYKRKEEEMGIDGFLFWVFFYLESNQRGRGVRIIIYICIYVHLYIYIGYSEVGGFLDLRRR